MRFARFIKHLATMIRDLVAIWCGCSFTKPNWRGFSNAGQSKRKKMKPETTRVRTNRSPGHFAITDFCKQLQMYLTLFGHVSIDVKIDWVIWSKIDNKNSAFVQASSLTSIFVGLSSADCLLSSSLWIKSVSADWRNNPHSLLMKISINVVDNDVARKRVDVSFSRAISAWHNDLSNSHSFLSCLKIFKREAANGIRLVWHRSARARTKLEIKIIIRFQIFNQFSLPEWNSFSNRSSWRGEYSSAGITKSSMYLILNRIEPHSPIGVIPTQSYQFSVSVPFLRLDNSNVKHHKLKY